ncbi:unnamed protein product [Knipowitschia caucasica]
MGISAVLCLCAASLAVAGKGIEGAGVVRSLVFSAESSTDYVTVTPQKPLSLGAFTLCLRLATELRHTRREIILFAYRTQNFDELNLWREYDGRIGLYMSSAGGVIFEMPTLGALQTHLCISWESSSGATTVFFDGRRSLTKIYQKNHHVRSGGIVIIGQDPDDYLGSFDYDQSFVGEISDINLWSKVLPDNVIREMANTGKTSQNGDVIDWSEANLETTGRVDIVQRVLESSEKR